MYQCQLCDQRATLHLTEIINGQKIEHHLCQKCAQNEGLTLQAHIQIPSAINQIAKFKQASEKIKDLHCPHCDLTWIEFRKKGLLGCAKDYEAFGNPLKALIHKAQNGGRQHVGRIPKNLTGRIGRETKLLKLRKNLQQAIDTEDYESAVRIRDEITKFALN